MNGEQSGTLGRAWSTAQGRFDAFLRSSVGVKMAGASTVVLIIATLCPWVNYDENFNGGYSSGTQTGTGLLIIPLGVLVLALLARHKRNGTAESGAVASLAVLAGGLLVSEGLQIHEPLGGFAWGFYVTAAAALGLFVGGVMLLGERPRDPAT